MSAQPIRVDIKGQTFGRLTVIDRAPSRRVGKVSRVFWTCRCECGVVREVRSDHMRMGLVRSCGCQEGKRSQYAERGYMTAHRRVAAERGKASEYDCVDCSQPAAEWSYVGTGYYSTDTSLYSPRCRSCHTIFDVHVRRTS
jgi:hypothetical protein